MKIIFCLGNPEQQYTGTRHNVGFWVGDYLAEQWGGVFKPSTKHAARVAEVTVGSEKVLLVQPHTYYNEVGRSARSLMDFYKLTPEDFLVIHDDLALPLGTIRTRFGGSSGGNNGLKSLAAHIGDTAHVRIGVWAEQHQAADKVGVVLGKFTKKETETLAQLLPTLRDITEQFITNTLAYTTYK